MTAKAGTLLINEVVPLRQKISNQSTLGDHYALGGTVPRFGNVAPDQYNPSANLCIFQVHH